MSRAFTLAILSDIHYASAAEQARGHDYESKGISNPCLRLLLKAHRHFLWLRHPHEQNHLLDAFLDRVGAADGVVANGDYTCDTAFVGVSDDAACQSARECLSKLRARFGTSFRASIGDHELGKFSFLGGQGGMRVASFYRARNELALEPLWRFELGRYVMIGIASSLVALPSFEPDTLVQERPEWERLRKEHLAEIRQAFSGLRPVQKVVLFCHDPTALPFLWREEAVRARLSQVELTIVGHLHSNLIFWKSQILAGMPPIRFLGHSVLRMSGALHEARYWKPFRVRLCPSLAGIELLKDGGFCTLQLDPDARQPVHFLRHRLPRSREVGIRR
jgi:hypothetical protein